MAQVKAASASKSPHLSGGPLLDVRNVVKTFGSLRAVDGCSLQVHPGEIVGLIGPNGAGKTTLFDIISGFQRPDQGQVYFRGADVTPLRPHQRASLGLGRTFQLTRLFGRLTVWENLMVAAPDRPQAREQAAYLLERMGLAQRRDDYARTLSYGQQKLLELARILMRDPVMVLLDEPAAGINPTLLEKVLDLVHELRDRRGMSFLVVEHNMRVVMNHCHRVVVMNAGQVIAEGPPQVVQQDERVLEAYFGRPGLGQGLWAREGAQP